MTSRATATDVAFPEGHKPLTMHQGSLETVDIGSHVRTTGTERFFS